MPSKPPEVPPPPLPQDWSSTGENNYMNSNQIQVRNLLFFTHKVNLKKNYFFKSTKKSPNFLLHYTYL